MASKWQVNLAVRQSSLPPPARLIMFALSDVADPKTGVIPDERTPALRELSSWTGLDKSTVTRHLDALDRDGWVHRDRPERDVARRTGAQTKYRLDVPRGAVCTTGVGVEDDEDGETVAQSAPQRDAQDTTPRGADDTTAVVQSASRPVVQSAPVPYTDEEETIKNLSSSPKPPKPPKAPKPEPKANLNRPDVDRICAHLVERMVGNGFKRPTITAEWRTAARLLIDDDKRTEEQIHRAIDWAQDDDFWRSNIKSTDKLRKQYDTLRLQAMRPNGRASPGHQFVERNGMKLKPETAQRFDDRERFKAMDEAMAANRTLAIGGTI